MSQPKAVLFAFVLLSPPVFAENAVTRWAGHAMQSVRAGNVGTPNAGRLYAMTTVAMYDAVNGIDAARHQGREHALVPAAGAPAVGHRGAAAAAAAHAVLVALVPSETAVLDAALAAELAALGEADPRVVAGRDWGRMVGQRVVTARSMDGTQTALTMPGRTGVGEHRAPFDARFRNMTPFGIRSKAPYLSPPPPALESREYAASFNDVKTFGQQDGNPVRNEIASFWVVEGGTVREPGVWIQATIAIIEEQHTDRSLSASARLLARVGMAVADAVMVSWETKATYFTWRPFFAVREADTDGNPATVADPSWTPRNTSIGASPEYNSGMSMFGGAMAAVVEAFYFPRRVSFCFATDSAPNGPRCYGRPLDTAVEAGRSRIYQGIHFQFSNVDSRRVGLRIGTEVALTQLRRCFGGGRICVP